MSRGAPAAGSGKPPVAAETAMGVGAVVFALLAAIAMASYAYSVVQSSRTVADYILILPTAVLGVAALLLAAVREAAKKGVSFGAISRADRQPVLLLVLTVVYAATVPYAGFDVGTAVFIALALLIQGERRVWLIALAALLGAGLTAWLFHDLLLVRMPVLFL